MSQHAQHSLSIQQSTTLVALRPVDHQQSRGIDQSAKYHQTHHGLPPVPVFGAGDCWWWWQLSTLWGVGEAGSYSCQGYGALIVLFYIDRVQKFGWCNKTNTTINWTTAEVSVKCIQIKLCVGWWECQSFPFYGQLTTTSLHRSCFVVSVCTIPGDIWQPHVR